MPLGPAKLGTSPLSSRALLVSYIDDEEAEHVLSLATVCLRTSRWREG